MEDQPFVSDNEPLQTDESVSVSKNKQKLFISILLLTLLVTFFLLALLGLYVFFFPRHINFKPKPLQKQSLSLPATIVVSKPTEIQMPTVTPTKAPDNPNSLAFPQKITSSDGEHSFLFGQPAGQNNKPVKKIIFSLPGHGSTADDDYAAWKDQLLANGTYALASLDWWDGNGETKADYYSPQEVVSEIQYFLKTQNYHDLDIVILEGFSRGSANTYPVVAYDVASAKPVIDGVISASGKYQSDFAMTPDLLNQKSGKPFAQIPWILACGEKDDNPTRDGCEGMTETQIFLQEKGANVLEVLKDSNGAHGSFHKSPLKLAEQAMRLFDDFFK